MDPKEHEKIRSAPSGILTNVEQYHPEFIHDESRLVGWMDSISFPQSEQDIRDQLSQMCRAKTPVTIQGMRTGLSGGAAPLGGHVLNLNKMMRIVGLRRDGDGGAFFLVLQPGALMREHIWRATATKEFDTAGWSAESLEALDAFKAAGPWLFTPDPSEPTVAIGGMVASNSSGARSLLYGPTRVYVERLRVVLVDGSVIDLSRGRQRASGRSFSVQTEDGRAIGGALPGYLMPEVKNSAGYFVRDNMDLLDLFVGSEGTLGVISEVAVRLIPAPAAMVGAMTFLPSESAALHFSADLKASRFRPAAIEYFDDRCVELFRQRRASFEQLQMGNEVPAGALFAVYVEYHGSEGDWAEKALSQMSEALVLHGGDRRSSWLGHGPEDLANFKQIKHVLPELVNGLVAEQQRKEPAICKLGTDLAVPDGRFDDLMALHRKDLEEGGFENHFVFGHLGDNNVHVNIIAGSVEEYEAGRQLCHKWARAAVAMGGTVSAEHGIGKVKKALLKEMYGPENIHRMADVKRCFDPESLLNSGNMFDPC